MAKELSVCDYIDLIEQRVKNMKKTEYKIDIESDALLISLYSEEIVLLLKKDKSVDKQVKK